MILCQEETVQGPLARDLAQDVARDEDRAEVEEEWAGLSQLVRVEIVSVRNVEQRLLMLRDSLVIQEAVRNVVQK